MLFKIGIHGDTLCGWCYLGKRSLDRAIEIFTQTHPDAEFEISWHSFILYPNLARGKHGATPVHPTDHKKKKKKI